MKPCCFCNVDMQGRRWCCVPGCGARVVSDRYCPRCGWVATACKARPGTYHAELRDSVPRGYVVSLTGVVTEA